MTTSTIDELIQKFGGAVNYCERTNQDALISPLCVKATFDALRELKELREWRPIEATPDHGKLLLIYYRNDCNKRRIVRGRYYNAMMEECSHFDCCEDWAEYSEEKDEYYLPAGFYEEMEEGPEGGGWITPVGYDVLFWRYLAPDFEALPQPPTESEASDG